MQGLFTSIGTWFTGIFGSMASFILPAVGVLLIVLIVMFVMTEM